MRTLILISLLLALVSSRTGGWKRESFEANSMLLDRCRQEGEDTIRANFGKNDDTTLVYPLEIYSQLVNGMNYKVVYALYDLYTDEVEVYTSTIYTGPFGKVSNDFESVNADLLESTEIPSNDAVLLSKIEKATKEYMNINDLEDIHIMKTFLNPITRKTKVYVVKTESDEGQFILFEDDGDVKVDAYTDFRKYGH